MAYSSIYLTKKTEKQGLLSIYSHPPPLWVLTSNNSRLQILSVYCPAEGVSSTPCLSIHKSVSEAHQVPALLEPPFIALDEFGSVNYSSSCFCAQKHHVPSSWYDLCEDG
uniref:Uncharacterized protein n=1 Tax=Salix viminalis TaxID=40686 RepID=A0A6N2M1Z7_SALVM